MLTLIARKLVIGAALIAVVTPAVFAEPLGTDPEPGGHGAIVLAQK